MPPRSCAPGIATLSRWIHFTADIRLAGVLRDLQAEEIDASKSATRTPSRAIVIHTRFLTIDSLPMAWYRDRSLALRHLYPSHENALWFRSIRIIRRTSASLTTMSADFHGDQLIGRSTLMDHCNRSSSILSIEQSATRAVGMAAMRPKACKICRPVILFQEEIPSGWRRSPHLQYALDRLEHVLFSGTQMTILYFCVLWQMTSNEQQTRLAGTR
jgi:hypothetical protein